MKIHPAKRVLRHVNLSAASRYQAWAKETYELAQSTGDEALRERLRPLAAAYYRLARKHLLDGMLALEEGDESY